MRSRPRKYHIGASGLLYAGVTLLLALGAINSQNNLLFIAFGLALGGLIISGILSGAPLMGLEVQREAPPTGRVGEALPIRYTVRNRGRFIPAFALAIREAPPKRRAQGVGRVGRRIGVGAEQPGRVLPPGEALAGEAFVVHVGAGGAVVAEAVSSPMRRGEARLGRIQATSTFPFGIVCKSVFFEQNDRVLIRPEAIRAPRRIEERSEGRADPTSASRSRVGRGLEYLGLREYSPGDSARHIAWRPSARLDTLVVREHVKPAPRRLWIALDLAPIEDDAGAEERDRIERLNERAISISAGLAEDAGERGAQIGLIAPGCGLRREPAVMSRGRVGILLDDLARLGYPAPDGRAARMTVGPDAVIVIHAHRDGRLGASSPRAEHLYADRLDELDPSQSGAAAPDGGSQRERETLRAAERDADPEGAAS